MTVAMLLSRLVALLGSIITLIQIFLLASNRETICFNDGCQIVDSLTTIPPLYINIAGFIFFQLVFWGLWIARNNEKVLQYVNALLLGGLAAEGVLVAFQQIIAQTFCSYCLIIFSMIIALNVLAGFPQIFRGGVVFFAVLIGFLSLGFESGADNPLQELDKGTFAVIEGDNRTKRYLFISSSCKYCEKLIESLNITNNCGLRFNPVDTIVEFEHLSVKRMESYSVEVNKKLLKAFGLNQIPVLLDVAEEGFQVVTGAGAIERHLLESCGQNQDNQVSPGYQSSIPHTGLDFLSPADESCAVDTDCEDLPLPRQVQ